MSQTLVKVGPEDHGRRMTLDEFEHAEGIGGYRYELSRGVVTVTDVPKPRHALQIFEIRRQIAEYSLSHRGRIVAALGGGECKLLIETLESERHPDVALYLSPMPPEDEQEDVWANWISEIVVEVVSRSSHERDYDEKPDEYCQFGVREYWIFDAEEHRLTVYRRSRGRWTKRSISPGTIIYTTKLLPGLEIDCNAVFDVAARK